MWCWRVRRGKVKFFSFFGIRGETRDESVTMRSLLLSLYHVSRPYLAGLALGVAALARTERGEL